MRVQGSVEWEDLSIFFDEFAVPGSLEIRNAGKTVSIDGIFDTPYQSRKFGDFIVDAEAPSFTCAWTEDMNDVRTGDKLTVGGSLYYLDSAPKPDGTGMCSLVLVPSDTQDAEGDEDGPDDVPTKTPKPTRMDGNLFRP